VVVAEGEEGEKEIVEAAEEVWESLGKLSQSSAKIFSDALDLVALDMIHGLYP
jgi:hypothetical protein